MSDGIGNRIISSCNKNGTCSNPTPPTCTNDKYLSVHCAKADTDAVALAKTARGEDITIHVVEYGTLSPKRILEENLKSIAGSKTSTDPKEFYHYGGDETAWDSIFANIAPQVYREAKPIAEEKVKKANDRNRREGSHHEGDDD